MALDNAGRHVNTERDFDINEILLRERIAVLQEELIRLRAELETYKRVVK